MASLLKQWFSAPRPHGADAAYIALVAQARKPFFYAELKVPDTLDGRFEMIVLHLFLLQHRLLQESTAGAVPALSKRESSHSTCDGRAPKEFARHVSEAFFDDMDRSVRELGVADTGVSKRIKAMGQAYHGRLQAYEAGLQDAKAMRAALARNLYGTLGEGDVAMLDRMRAYIAGQVAALDTTSLDTITNGDYAWVDPTTFLA